MLSITRQSKISRISSIRPQTVSCCLRIPIGRPLSYSTSTSTFTLSSNSSELGLRFSLPPDSNAKTNDEMKPGGSGDGHEPRHDHEAAVSDAEWELRTGRAIDVLTETLPHFFTNGLISSIDRVSGTPRAAASIHIPIASVNPLDFRASNEDVETIYSPKVRLSYTPPVALPAPFPKTLHVEGLPLYLASSVFIRHTLNALYTDLQVVLRKVIVQTPGSQKAIIGAIGGGDEGESQPITHKNGGVRNNREKSLFIGLTVNGVARVSGSTGEWDVNSTYTFSPLTGLIHIHTVNSIQPAPHQTVYDALRSSLGKVFGFGLIGESGQARPGGAGVRAGDTGPAVCDGRIGGHGRRAT